MTDIAQRIGVTVQNDSGMDIPPFSVVVVTSLESTIPTEFSDGVMIHHVQQYNCGLAGNVMVTGEVTIPKGAIGILNGDPSTGAVFGRAFMDQFIYVAIDTTIAKPSPGEQWGPSNGSWVVTRGGIGFFAQGYAATDSTPDSSIFLRTFVRAAPTVCPSSSSNSSSNSSGSSSGSAGSVSGSGSSSAGCGCVTVVTSVTCGSGGLSVTYGQARGCC